MEENIIVDELEKLEEINQEITNIEKKLENLPALTEQNDSNKYNRKQRRRMERMMKHDEKEKQKKVEQQGSTFVTRREFVGLFQSMQKIRDRMYYIDVLTSAMEKILIDKNIITEEELKITIKSETEKALAFQDIQKGQKDYENRINKCIELGVDPKISIISQQIYEDAEMSIEEKKELAKKYNLEDLLKIFGAEEKSA